MTFIGTYMGNVSFSANDPILRVLAELHIVVIREGMPVDRISEEVKELQIQMACLNQTRAQYLHQKTKDVEKTLLRH